MREWKSERVREWESERVREWESEKVAGVKESERRWKIEKDKGNGGYSKDAK